MSDNRIPEEIHKYVIKYLTLMKTGKIECNHSFYLKMYHIDLANKVIQYKIPFDLLMLDEAGDLNPVTLAIFLLLPANKKVMVGDPNQNIYSFNNTINGFIELRGQGVDASLSRSFRVSNDIAKPLEAFSRDTFNENIHFVGVDYDNTDIDSEAYIARTNSGLIGKMIELNKFGKEYSLVRPAKVIFALPRMLLSLKPHGKITNPEYKYLQDDLNTYTNSGSIREQYPTALSYIAAIHSDDPNIRAAVNLIRKYGARDIIDASYEAVKHEASSRTKVHDLTLCTIHSSKGLEYDKVEVAEDANQVISKVLEKPKDTWTNEEYEECRLYYVLISRAKKDIDNAIHLYKYYQYI